MSAHEHRSTVLSFLGGAGTVTGSKFLMTAAGRQILIDCGLFQGLKDLRLRNWDRFPTDPRSIDAVVLTHAHLDHSGYLPLLRRSGFHGPIFATKSTVDLCRILLPDSGRLQEEEARYANKAGYSRHAPAKPLYSEEDALDCFNAFQPIQFDSPFEIARIFRATFRPAGHILGSATMHVEIDGADGAVVFSGDLGRSNHPLLKPPAKIGTANTVLIESTYGDWIHDDLRSVERFENAIIRTAARGGVIIIPSFAVDRTEIVLFHLRKLVGSGRLPLIPIFVDSPMALAALQLYKTAISNCDWEVRPEVAGHPEMIEPPGLVEVKTVDESIALNSMRGPMIIISASGMATGGRVLHHLAHRLGDARNTIILVGYQAAGTRGRMLLEGAPNVKLLGRYHPVRAEIVDVPAFSVHADQNELVEWLRSAPVPPEMTFVVHGEPAAAESLRGAIEKHLRFGAAVARQFEHVRVA